MAIVNYIDGDRVKFKELMGHFLGDTYRLSQRAAWAVNYCAEHHHELVTPYFNKLVQQLERDDVHVAAAEMSRGCCNLSTSLNASRAASMTRATTSR